MYRTPEIGIVEIANAIKLVERGIDDGSFYWVVG
jgi:hypothetical protein